MGHMSIARHVTQILHNEEVGPVEIVLLMYKLEQVLVKKEKVRAFISLVQTIEDRLDHFSLIWRKPLVISLYEMDWSKLSPH